MHSVCDFASDQIHCLVSHYGIGAWEGLALWISEEAPGRATSVWSEVMRHNHGAVLCLYVIPKYFLGSKVTLSQFGSPQRVGEQSQQVMEVLSRCLTLDRLPSDGRISNKDLFSRALLLLAGRVTELLAEQCSEKGWDVPLHTEKGRRGEQQESAL